MYIFRVREKTDNKCIIASIYKTFNIDVLGEHQFHKYL